MDNALAQAALAKINSLEQALAKANARIAELEGEPTAKSKEPGEIGLIKARKLSDVPRAGYNGGAASAAARNFGEGISKAHERMEKERRR